MNAVFTEAAKMALIAVSMVGIGLGVHATAYHAERAGGVQALAVQILTPEATARDAAGLDAIEPSLINSVTA